MTGVETRVRGGEASKPFIVTAVLFVFAGSIVGSIWLMIILGLNPPSSGFSFSIHRVLQLDGFLTLLVMGIGYMIVPRFRNTGIPSVSLAYASFALVLASVAASISNAALGGSALDFAAAMLRLTGIFIFAGLVLWTLRIRPKLLRMADYFIALSVLAIISVSVMDASGVSVPGPLAMMQMWMLFPVLMIFGIEYKTMPSFLGFIRPRKRLGQASVVLAVAAVVMGVASMVIDYAPLPLAFNGAILSSGLLLAASLYIFGGFDNSEILLYLQGENKARYFFTVTYSRIAFAVLYAGSAFALLYYFSGSSGSFLYYDLAIHFTAIGFIGITVALYLPLMLPPILGRQVHFAKFTHIPLFLLMASLTIRVAADLYLGMTAGPLSYLLMSSGWLVVAALAVFVTMLHRSMKDQGTIPERA